jgi:hypothetical protein
MDNISLFSEIAAVYSSLCWFISMSVMGLPKPIMSAAILVPMILGALPFLVNNDKFRTLKKDFTIKLSIALMPVFWVIAGICGGIFRYKTTRWPPVTEYIILALLIGFLAYGIYCIFKNERYRIFTAVLFLVNIYFALSISLCALMSIANDWI